MIHIITIHIIAIHIMNAAGVQDVLHQWVQWMFGEANKDFHDHVT